VGRIYNCNIIYKSRGSGILLKNNNEGSFTVEATLVFSTVLIAIMVLIYICMMLYRQSYVQTIADRAAGRGAEVWSSPYKDMFMAQITTDKMEDPNLYWRIIDNDKDVKKSKIEKYIEYMLKSDVVFGQAKDLKINADICSDYIIYKKLRVTVSAKYKTPAGSLLKMVGLGEYVTVTAKSEAVIDEPSEFIRNTDFVVDTAVEVNYKTGNKAGNAISKITEPLKEKFTGMISKIKDFIDK
jgi:hypothetical protein